MLGFEVDPSLAALQPVRIPINRVTRAEFVAKLAEEAGFKIVRIEDGTRVLALPLLWEGDQA